MFGMSGAEASTWSVAMQHVGLSVQEGGMQLNYFTVCWPRRTRN